MSRRNEYPCPVCGGTHPAFDELKGEPEVVTLRRSRCRLRARVAELESEVRELRVALAAARRTASHLAED